MKLASIPFELTLPKVREEKPKVQQVIETQKVNVIQSEVE